MHTTTLQTLYKQWSGEEIVLIKKLPQSGSDRIYYRIKSANKRAIGVYNKNLKENNAFIHFSKHFKAQKMNVPEIYAENLDKHCYLLSDLGEETLFDNLLQTRTENEFPQHLVPIYKQILTDLVHFQLKAGKHLDYDFCYPRPAFDKQSILWDLHYFKYYFLKLAQISFDEQLLEDDFQAFASYLLETKHDYFMYRDFQSRNIMLHNGKPAYIDYQGGRKGALQYDVASLLYDAKANLPEALREELLRHYISVLKKQQSVDSSFEKYYYGYVLVRIMQAMGAYGFRGFYEKKEHFLKSIPYAMHNLSMVLKKKQLPIKIPHLLTALKKIAHSTQLLKIAEEAQSKLSVTINSFSFKRGIPIDKSDNGGGFVFDCRAIHNPGRYEEYKMLTGKDTEVIRFFQQHSDMEAFLTPIKQLITQSIKVYIKRDFTHLQVNFGCTGGRHRSVYAAEQVAAYLKNHFDVKVVLRHIEREIEEQKH